MDCDVSELNPGNEKINETNIILIYTIVSLPAFSLNLAVEKGGSCVPPGHFLFKASMEKYSSLQVKLRN